jgi:hypothetical protein
LKPYGPKILINRLSLKAILFLLIFIVAASAKSALQRKDATAFFNASRSAGTTVNTALRAFETTLTPYLRTRAAHAVSSRSLYAPSQADLFTIAKHWNGLSKSFRSLYLSAMELPKSASVYASPGGHFDILYKMSGDSAVDKTDTIGYSGSNWRVRQQGPNGVPDYVDEVAFAADSSWSMEIDRFGFVAPHVYTDARHTSSRYKILLRTFDGPQYDYYGQTNPFSGQGGGGIGEASYIEIRNEWSDQTLWNNPPRDYTDHPEKAVRVTCAHEFFHAVQYSMAWKDVQAVYLDSFPITWTEGCAVLMEDLCFDYVNDYLQYVGSFFADPRAPVLDNSNDVYKNAIVCMYLYHRALGAPGIGFIKNIYFNNYNAGSPVPFLDNLRATALQSGRTWTGILGSYFTESYYTGNRAAAGRFIPDAPVLANQWGYDSDVPDNTTSIQKDVALFGMNTFSYVNKGAAFASASPNLTVEFFGDTIAFDTNGVWSINCILKKDNLPDHDSMVALPLSYNSRGTLVVAGWPDYTEALVVAVNAKNDRSRRAAVSFTACGDNSVTIAAGASSSFSAAPQATVPNATVRVHADKDLRCSLSIARTSVAAELTDIAVRDDLAPTGAFFDLSFPLSWLYDAAMDLTIRESAEAVRRISDTGTVWDRAVSVYRWDDPQRTWRVCPAAVSRSPDSGYVFELPVTSGGLFGLFGLKQDTTMPAVVAFPNPARLRQGDAVSFIGKDILEIWIYTIDGVLLSHAVTGAAADPSLRETKNGFSWRLQNNRGASVSPGVYYARVGYKDSLTKGMKRKAQKLFVIP